MGSFFSVTPSQKKSRNTFFPDLYLLNYMENNKKSDFIECKVRDGYKKAAKGCWYVYRYLTMSHLEERNARNAGKNK